AVVQVPVPIVPQVVVHTLALPAAQVNESSTAPSQSSSMPLQISAGGTHAAPVGMLHSAVQAPIPAVPHEVVHAIIAPGTHAKVCYTCPSHAWSRASQTSAVPG